MVTDETVSFNVEKEKNEKTREILKEVYKALTEKGYNPINQIVGYILSGDPTYITSHNGARNLIRQVERDELLDPVDKPQYYVVHNLRLIHHIAYIKLPAPAVRLSESAYIFHNNIKIHPLLIIPVKRIKIYRRTHLFRALAHIHRSELHPIILQNLIDPDV